jgi:hypothetical protein
LEAQLAAAKKNSRNSSKPPSSDITKPPADPKERPTSRKKRKIGGQLGHPKHESDLTIGLSGFAASVHKADSPCKIECRSWIVPTVLAVDNGLPSGLFLSAA